MKYGAVLLLAPWLALAACSSDPAAPATPPTPLPDLGAVDAAPTSDAKIVATDAARAAADLAPAMLVEHLVLPSDTGIAAASPDDPHEVFLQAADKNQLLLFFPGTGGKPSGYRLVQIEAAAIGYHVIGLAYDTKDSLRDLCGDVLSCYGPARLEEFDGVDHSTVAVSDANNCIKNRIIKVLQYLTTKYPAENWGQYLDNGSPAWSKIVTSGHSQGGGHAAFIAQLYSVARVGMFSSVVDANSAMPPASATWLGNPFMTPKNRFYGFAHTMDTANYPNIRSNWTSIGMDSMGAAVSVDSGTPPYSNTHELTSSRPLASPHNQIVTDGTPLMNGVPVYRDAWRYVIGP